VHKLIIKSADGSIVATYEGDGVWDLLAGAAPGAKFDVMLVTRAAGAGSATQNIALANEADASAFNGFWASVQTIATAGEGVGSVGQASDIFGGASQNGFSATCFGTPGAFPSAGLYARGPVIGGAAGEIRDYIATGWALFVSFPVAGQVRLDWTQVGGGFDCTVGMMVLGA